MADARAITRNFKPVAGGYVFRGPDPWVIWRLRFYLVNETQRAELASILAARGLGRARGYIFLIAGKPIHPPGEHEYNAGITILDRCLRLNKDVQTQIVRGGWPADESSFRSVSTAPW